MSKTVKYECNVCGKELKGTDGRSVKDESAQLHLWGPGEPRGSLFQRFDLCLSCFDGFVAFLETGKPREEGEE